jgi:phosphoglycolate phosphatase-like HAD superfamily hydrolase
VTGSSLSPVRLVLFDVDGTLLTCGQRTRPLLGRALTEVFGPVPGIESYDFAGKTDPRIVLDLAAGAGVGADEARAALPRVRDRYLAILEAGLPAGSVSALPGVPELLARLAATGGPALGLLTGNWRRGAEVKLERAGLGGRFRFGAFGDDGLDRDELPPVALARAAEAAGRRFAAAETLIVGDTPHDVACARAHGMRCLAVATGSVPAARLAAAGADWVVADQSAVDERLRRLFG